MRSSFFLFMLGMIFSIWWHFIYLKNNFVGFFGVFIIPKNNDTHELLVIFYER